MLGTFSAPVAGGVAHVMSDGQSGRSARNPSDPQGVAKTSPAACDVACADAAEQNGAVLTSNARRMKTERRIYNIPRRLIETIDLDIRDAADVKRAGCSPTQIEATPRPSSRTAIIDADNDAAAIGGHPQPRSERIAPVRRR